MKRGGDLPGGGFSGQFFFVWPRPEAWILSFRFPNIGWIAFLGVIHCWDLHPHFIVVIGKNENMAKLSNLSGEFLQMNGT